MYDGSEEFWVVTKETGKRQESHTYEEIHEQRKKARLQITMVSSQCSYAIISFGICLRLTPEAESEPIFQLGDKFKGMQSMDARIAREKAKETEVGSSAESNKFGQAGGRFDQPLICQEFSTLRLYRSIYMLGICFCSLPDERPIQTLHGQRHAEKWKVALPCQRSQNQLFWR